MPKYTQVMTNLFDLEADENGVLRMPFNPADYGEDNGIMRQCHACAKEAPQGEMKELSSEDQHAYKDARKLHASSIFFCKDCWFSTDISNAAYWNA